LNEITSETAQKKSPLKGITEPFIELAKAPGVLWALNFTYLIEGFVYLGTLAYLAMFFNKYVQLSDVHAGWMVGLMTAGITFSMLFFGSRVDSWGLRKTLFTALGLMFSGRVIISISPSLGLHSGGLFSPLNLVAALGILLIVVGFGMYQPAVYAGTRAVTTTAASAMAFAMLYALYNLGGWFPTFMSPIRNAFGLQGALGFYSILTLFGIVGLAVLLTKKTLEKSLGENGANKTRVASVIANEKTAERVIKENADKLPLFAKTSAWFKNHPLADSKFSFFIFSLIPIQTLFVYLWFILPQYVDRAYTGTWIGKNFETAISLNALLIFILCPIVASLSNKSKVYNMMILGTSIMAVSPFLLTGGPTVMGLFGYIIVLSIGEAVWKPRFLQYAAEIAPEGRTGAYMGVAQFPWFITKIIVPLYSGAALSKWCPPEGPTSTGTMWLVFGLIAIVTPLLLLSAKGWAGKVLLTELKAER
jgi:MFS family permease